MISIGLVSTITASIALVAIAIFISLPLFIRNRRAAPGLVYFVILCYSLAAWLMANILSDIFLPQALFWIRLSFASISVGLFGFLMFANRFPQPRYTSRSENIIHSSALGFVVLLTLSDLFIPHVVVEEGIATVVPGSLYGVFIVYVTYTLILAISRVVRVRTAAPTYWEQAQLILVGIGTAAGVALLTNLILPLIFGTNSLYWLASVATLVFVATTAYAIVRRQLFDIRGALARAFAYIGSIAVLGLLLGLSVAYIVDWLDLTGERLQIAIIVATVAMAVLYPFIKLFFDTITEKVFYRRTYNVQDAINEMTMIFSRAQTLDSMATRTINQLRHLLGSERVALVLTSMIQNEKRVLFSTPKEWLDVNLLHDALQATSKQKIFIVDSFGGIDESLLKVFSDLDIGLVSQLQSPTERIGYILLGHRKNGVAYTKRDVTFISTISDECAIAVQSFGRLEEILALNLSLEDKINAATEELRANNKKLKQLDQTKDEFISLTSHQLRTPLTTIKGYISMLLDGDAGELQPQQRKLLEEAFNSSQRMVHLISDFLNISRIQTGKFTIELSDVNLAEILDEEIGQLRVSAASRQIELVYDKPSDFPIMPVDEGKIRQVMMNFIDNALYYSPPKTTVKMQLTHTASTVEFKVIDQGIGVPAAEQHKLFAKFSRASNAKKQRPDGTGIGLFMAKKVIVAMSGAIIFESKEGVGSTFGFRLNR